MRKLPSWLEWLGSMADWFGSDVFERVTMVEYWNANQMAHAMMGFFGVTMVGLAATKLGLPIWAGMAFMFVPFLKDLTDVFHDNHPDKKDFSKDFHNRAEIIHDTATDLSFWGMGGLLALAVLYGHREQDLVASGLALAVAISFIFVLLVSCRHYWRQKRRFDQTGVRYFVRLARFPGRFADGNARQDACTAIKEFLELRKQPQFMLITGLRDSGKTSLASAIGTEASVWARNGTPPRARFLTMDELEGTAELPGGLQGDPGVLDDSRPISPGDANILIVDDVDDPPEKPSPQFLCMFRTKWVVLALIGGNDREGFQDRCQAWQEWLQKHFAVEPATVPVIELCGIEDSAEELGDDRSVRDMRVLIMAFLSVALAIISLVGSLAVLLFM